ncbi:tripartite tricarboxylate transporter TctB family protein [Nonomuraea longispora]|uniref:tripartite tricarboxylate transporter TctB family protein n=1 Tax=Nonomuraea longispora TaxID=1848320 RepID=UPI001404E25A|nr:tripartite tricarboxylate transporter TctB family protein [Nonomuraea longispora]
MIAGGSLLVLGLLYGALALDEGLGTMADSGAGFFPFVVALVLVAASAVVLLQSRRRTPGGLTPPADDEKAGAEGDAEGDAEGEGDGEVRWWRIAGVLAAALLVPAVGDTVGMITTLAISLVLMAKVMGVSRWSSAVIFGFSFGAATWLVFVRWLAVPLPAGMLGLF